MSNLTSKEKTKIKEAIGTNKLWVKCISIQDGFLLGYENNHKESLVFQVRLDICGLTDLKEKFKEGDIYWLIVLGIKL